MNFIKIFIASSIVEFESERKELGDYIRSLNDLYVKKGVYIELTLCEDFTNALAASRKQEEYNDSIRGSDYFYVLMGRKAGEYTIEEFNVALEQFQKGGTPRIYTYFVQLPENETPSQSITDFMNRLGNELHHYYTMFTNIDSVKLNMLLELSRNPVVNTEVKFSDGNATIDDKKVLSLEGIPVYAKNEALQKLIEKKKEYDQQFAIAVGEAAKDPGNTEATMNLLKLSEERTHILDQIHEIENSILQLTQQIEEKRSLNKELNWREKKAMEYTDQGNSDAAILILRDAAWDKEIEQAETLIENQKKKIREYISGKRALISNLKTKGVDEQVEQEICGIYEKLCDLAEQYNIEGDIIAEYVIFLDTQNIMDKVGTYAKKAIHLSEIKDSDISRTNILKMYCYLGNSHFEAMRYEEADKCYLKALGDAEELYNADNKKWKNTLRDILSWRYWFLSNTGRYQEAAEINSREVEITRALCEENKEKYEKDYYFAWGKYGGMLMKMSRYDEALRVLQETLQFYEKKQTSDREAELKKYSDIVSLKDLIAQIYNVKHQYDKAVSLMQEEIKKCRVLAQENPSRFMPFLASMLHNLGIHYSYSKEYEKAVECQKESIQITRVLNEKYPENYLDNLVSNLGALATVLRYTSATAEADPIIEEAYQLLEEQYQKDPLNNSYKMAVLCTNYANHLTDFGKLEDAEKIAKQAVEAAKTAASSNPGYYKHTYWLSLNSLGRAFQFVKKYSESESVHLEALQVAEELAEQDADAYTETKASSCRNLAAMYKDSEQWDKAIDMYRKTISIEEELNKKEKGEYTARLATDYYNLGNTLYKTGEYEESKAAYSNHLTVCEQKKEHTAGDEKMIREAMFWIAYENDLTNHPEEAEKMYAKAQERMISGYTPEDKEFLTVHRARSYLYRIFLEKQNRKQKAYEICKEEVRAWKDLRKLNEGKTAKEELDAIYKCGLLANELGHKEEANEYFREAICLCEENDYPNYEGNRAFAYYLSGFNLETLGQLQEAITSQKKAYEIFTKLSETNTKYLTQVEGSAKQLSQLYGKTGNNEESESFLEKQKEAHTKNEEIKYPEFYKQLKEFKGCGWGPERKMVTMEEPAQYPVLNSIKNNNILGDERNFFRLREADTEERFNNLHKVEPGKTYELYTYFCNAAKPSLKEEGTLHNVRVQVVCPKHLEDHKLTRIRGILTTDNSDPNKMWCDSYVWAEEPVDFVSVKGAVLHSDKTGLEGIPLALNYFREGGELVGISSPDGELPCTGNDYCGYVIVKVKAVKRETK